MPVYPFLGEGSSTKIDILKKHRALTYSNLSTGGHILLALSAGLLLAGGWPGAERATLELVELEEATSVVFSGSAVSAIETRGLGRAGRGLGRAGRGKGRFGHGLHRCRWETYETFLLSVV